MTQAATSIPAKPLAPRRPLAWPRLLAIAAAAGLWAAIVIAVRHLT